MNKLIILTIFITLCIGSIESRSNNDLCVFNSTGKMYDYTSVMNCFYSIKYNPKVAHHTIEQIRKAFSLFVFKDIANDSPDPEIYQTIDLDSELDRIDETVYNSDFEFQRDLTELFLRYQDAHSMVFYPNNYRNFIWTQPFPLSSYVDEHGQQQIGIVRIDDYPWLIESYYNKQSNGKFRLRDYLDVVILEINGVDALYYMIDWADKNVGTSKDKGTRLNLALHDSNGFGFGVWNFRASTSSKLPREEYVTYKIQFPDGHVTTEKFAYAGLTGLQYGGKHDWVAEWENFWKDQPMVNELKKTKTFKVREFDLLRDEYKFLNNIHLEKKYSVENNAENKYNIQKKDQEPNCTYKDYKVLACGDGIDFHQINKDTAAVHIKTFAPQDVTSFRKSLEKGFAAMYKKGISKLIMDLRWNGGGYINLGRGLLKALYGKPWYGPSDMPTNDFSKLLAKNAVDMEVAGTPWSPDTYIGVPNGETYTTDSWINPGINRTRGGINGKYSELVTLNPKFDKDFLIQVPDGFFIEPNNLIMVTKGSCGSTCALVSDHLTNYERIKTVVVGGIKGRVQQSCSFNGLQVLDSPGLYQIWNILAPNSSLTPDSLYTSSAFRFCDRQIYNIQAGEDYGTGIPLEYKYEPSTYRLEQFKEGILDHRSEWKRVNDIYFGL